jgi:hypothetical protein
MGYDVSVVKDAIGDKEVPGATAAELVKVGVLRRLDLHGLC